MAAEKLFDAAEGAGVSGSGRNVVVVGLGEAGLDHVRALQGIEGPTVIAGIDPDYRRRRALGKYQVRPYETIPEAANDMISPDVVVVATPTQFHADGCDEVAKCFANSAILVEKPAADNLGHARQVIQGDSGRAPVNVAYHLAFSAEVDWGLSQALDKGRQLGAPVRIEAWFADPYRANLESAQARLGTSWLDSGINALSVIERFAKLTERTALSPVGPAAPSAYQATFACEWRDEEVTAVVLTSWDSVAPTRTTRIRYSSGAELVMDHNAVSAYLVQDGRIADMFADDGRVPRREAHYRSLYRSWLVEGIQVFPRETSMRLHTLLLDGLPRGTAGP